MIITQLVATVTKKTLIFLIEHLWPLIRLEGYCRYTVSCSQYAKLMLEQEPLSRALVLIIKRVLSCSPFGRCCKNKGA